MNRLPERDHRLDFIKGSCVLFMVLYHVVSMASAVYGAKPVLNRLRFVHASFLFISGWLVGSYYASRVASGQAGPLAVYRRLVIRGLKLCGLFLLLNVAVYVSGMGYSFATLRQLDSVGEVLWLLFVEPRGSLMAGEVLWEIGLFLVVIAPLIVLLPIWCFCLIGAVLWIAGLWGHVPFFLCIGTFGILAGWHLRSDHWDKVLRNKFVGAACVITWLLYLVFVLPIIRISSQVPLLAVVISVGEILLWFTIFIIVFHSRVLSGAGRCCECYGKYTLVAYCCQLIIARVIANAYQPESFIVYCGVAMIINVLAMHWVLRSIDVARKRSWIVDHSYRAIFA